MPIFTHPANKSETTIPETIIFGEQTLNYCGKKTAGWSVGGWYKNENGKEYLAKFAGADSSFPYMEKLLNDLARICVGDEFVAGEVEVAHGEVEGKIQNCLITSKIENYQDLINIKAESKKESDSVPLRKPYAPSFHRFYSFAAFIGNDDLNEENLGLISDEDHEEKRPVVIDYGITPTFLHPQQIEHSATPFHLASFTGHRNLNLMQLVRRRYFGHDDFLNPKDRLKPQKENLKPEDISYLSIFDGAKKIIEQEDAIAEAVKSSIESVMQDENLSQKTKETYQEKYSRFAEILKQRSTWMAENFATDLKNISDEKDRERFAAIKWRLHPKFLELMEFEAKVFKQCAQNDLNENFQNLSDLLPKKTREEILELDLKTVEKSDLQQLAKENFMLHNSIAAGDFKMAKWLVENDISDINQNRTLRTHNYQLFRTTPLHAAIAIYHDALFYQKSDELQPLREIIGLLEKKFLEKNGDKFDESRKKEYEEKANSPFAIEITFSALGKYKSIVSEEALAATTIQRAFKATQLAKEEQNIGNTK